MIVSDMPAVYQVGVLLYTQSDKIAAETY